MNFAMHAFNSIFMLIDLFLVAQPIHFNHVIYPFIFSTTYTLFSYIYFLCGGTGKLNRPSIYPILNWNKPIQTLVISTFALFFVIIVYVLVYGLVLMRRKLVNKWKPIASETNGGFQEKYSVGDKEVAENSNPISGDSILDII